VVADFGEGVFNVKDFGEQTGKSYLDRGMAFHEFTFVAEE
jgi:hypothetical protein